MFSVPSKCGFLRQFGAIYFLNIRPKWSSADEPTPVQGVSKDSTCHSSFYISLSFSNFFIVLIFRQFLSGRNYSKRFYIKSGMLWKSSNRLRWGIGKGKVLYKSETWSVFLWKCNCQLSLYRKM